MTTFEEYMSKLGYVLEEQDGNSITYQKNVKYSRLVLVINLEKKYINPILVPKSVVLYEHDLDAMIGELREVRNNANQIARKTNGVYKVLNSERK